MVKNKHRILNGSQKMIVLGGPKEEEARGVLRKVKIGPSESGRRTFQSEKSVGSDFDAHRGRGKERKGKGKEGAYQSGFSASEAHSEERKKTVLGNQTIDIPTSLTILVQHFRQLEILHGWHQSL